MCSGWYGQTWSHFPKRPPSLCWDLVLFERLLVAGSWVSVLKLLPYNKAHHELKGTNERKLCWNPCCCISQEARRAHFLCAFIKHCVLEMFCLSGTVGEGHDFDISFAMLVHLLQRTALSSKRPGVIFTGLWHPLWQKPPEYLGLFVGQKLQKQILGGCGSCCHSRVREWITLEKWNAHMHPLSVPVFLRLALILQETLLKQSR